MSVVHVWAGAATQSSVWVRGKVGGASTRLVVSATPDLSAPMFFGPVAPTGDGIVSLEATGLEADTRYWYALEDDGVLDTDFAGTVRTHPPVGEPASFTFGAAGDAGLTGAGDDSHITSAVSNNPVFDTMRIQAAAEDWLFFAHLGDIHYRNISTANTSLFRAAYDDVLTYNGTLGADARQGRFYRDVSLAYVWDDHDFGPNNSDSSAAGRDTACSVYRERVPHYPLPAGGGAQPIYQSWQVGRVLFVAADVRADRDPNGAPQTATKTMLGTAQKVWLEQMLSTSTAEALVWIMPSQWIALGPDTWASFMHERDELVLLLGRTGWLHRTIMLTADKHALAISSGPGNAWGAFPIYMFASMDASYGVVEPMWDLGMSVGRQRYGTVRVEDRGHTIALTGTGWINGTEWKSHTAYVHAGAPGVTLGYRRLSALTPVYDDQGAVNLATVTREDGGEATYARADGPLGIDTIGQYDDSATLTVATDAQLPDQAGWRVHKGTTAAARYPSATVDLAKYPDVADQVAGMAPGDRLVVQEPPPWLPPGAIDLLVEGGRETIGVHTWRLELTAQPGEPWTVARTATEPVGPAEPNRCDTSGSELARPADDVDPELVVHTVLDGTAERAPWINSDGPAAPNPLFPDAMPVDLRTGGEVVRATAITPLAWDAFTRTETDTWGTSTSGHPWSEAAGSTSDRSVNGTSGLITLNSSPATLRFQFLQEVLADCEVLVAITPSQVATGASFLPAVLLRVDGTYYRCRVRLGTSGDVSMDLANGTETVGSAVLTPYRYGAGTRLWLRARIVGQRVLGRVWPDTAPEPIVWHLDETVVTDTNPTGGVGVSLSTFAGNTNVAPVVAFDDFQIVTPQRFTVERSANSVAKEHAAGTRISLAQPAIVAL